MTSGADDFPADYPSRPIRGRPSDKPLIGIAHPRLYRGGSEGALMWAVDALVEEYRVHLITTGEPDLPSLNRLYGTTIPEDAVTVVPVPLPRFLMRTDKASALRGHWHQRFCRRIADRYDVLFSAYNLCDFGRPAIQRIADFSWAPDVRAAVDPDATGSRGFHQTNFLNRLYLGMCRMVSAPSGRNLFTDDLLIANSHWTASVLKEKYGARQVRIVYPPVPGDFPDIPWEQRTPDFVCLGRLSREKRIETVIEILRRVRVMGHHLKLHIVGGSDGSLYARHVEETARAEGDWIQWHGELQGDGKRQLLAQCRYGIHACPFEGFGIAVAEMVRAGCIPFVPATGGAAEIVGHNEALCWRSPDEAAAKIDRLRRTESEQAGLGRALRKQAALFPVSSYRDALRDMVRTMLVSTSPAPRSRPTADNTKMKPTRTAGKGDPPEEQFYRELWSQKNWNTATPNADEQARADKIISFIDTHAAQALDRPLRILDIGCGRGWLTNVLSTYGEAIGIDPAHASVQRARELFPQLDFRLRDSSELLREMGPECFDLIVSSEVIEHVEQDQQILFLRNIYALTRPGGFAILTTPRGELQHRWAKRQGAKQPVEEWIAEQQLQDLCRKAGFTIRQTDRAFPASFADPISDFLHSRWFRGSARLFPNSRLLDWIRFYCAIYQVIIIQRPEDTGNPRS